MQIILQTSNYLIRTFKKPPLTLAAQINVTDPHITTPLL